MAKKINKIPITIKAMLIRLVMVEVFELDTFDTLLTVEDVFEVNRSFVEDVLFVLVVLLSTLLFVVLVLDVLEFSVKFKSIA